MKSSAETPSTLLSQQGKSTEDEFEGSVARHPFLQGLSPHQLRILKDCSMLIEFKPGELILREGDPANRFYLILEGSVVLESHRPDCGLLPIQTIGAGDVLGWSWLFAPYYWHFNARALTDTKAVFFYGTSLREECEGDHEFGFELVRRMTEVILQRLQATRRRLLEESARARDKK